eukprot:1007300_1
MSAYHLLRSKYKQKFRNELSLFKKTKTYNNIQTKLNLRGYDFVVSEDKYTMEVIPLIATIYTQKNPWFKLFEITPNDVEKIFTKRCKFAIRNARMLFAIDKKTGAVKGGTLLTDLCDKCDFAVEQEQNPSIIPKRCVYLREIYQFLYVNIDKKK